MNICSGRKQQTDKTPGYCIFYDSNEPMQNYLLSCYNREGIEDVSDKEKEELRGIWKSRKRGISFPVKGLFQKLLCIIVVLLLAIAVTTIDEFREMHGFVEAAARAVLATDIQY